jgi:hypothetical protein
MRQSSGRFRALGYMLLTASALLLTVIAMTRPSFGLALVALAVVLGLVAAVSIWRANALEERS